MEGQVTLVRAVDAAQNPHDVLERLLELHGHDLLRTARQHSPSATDAEDAYQRGLEIVLTKAPTDDLERLYRWSVSVIRNEALKMHRSRRRIADAPIEDFASTFADCADGPDEQLLRADDLRRGREALGRIKPDQLRCLLLRADGLAYPDICRITGFTYAKVNRCLSEGRREFASHVNRLESGEVCKRIFPLIARLADNELSADREMAARAHLEGCFACQVNLRACREAPRQAAIAFPVAAAGGIFAQAGDALSSLFASLQERLAPVAAPTAEASFAKKAAAVVAVSAAIAGGGVTIDQVVSDPIDAHDGAPAIAPVAPAPAPSDLPDTAAGESSPGSDEAASVSTALPKAPTIDDADRTRANSADQQRLDNGGGAAAGDPNTYSPAAGEEPIADTIDSAPPEEPFTGDPSLPPPPPEGL